ncbi:hypothetical protein AVEN_207387-1 [Araneus ventricosus]|uniref:Uncharacterized protein n=1 Tax=Araneus ventricosus TaxID=182803 RepID=A0A4Y2M390_ARAVE|nr:hypothetical protein AVEN_119881-1 [Araneus ventricosus]GBN21237.1 hypothetical protein AVEN_207387-1 [Araneus ventricosus]
MTLEDLLTSTLTSVPWPTNTLSEPHKWAVAHRLGTTELIIYIVHGSLVPPTDVWNRTLIFGPEKQDSCKIFVTLGQVVISGLTSLNDAQAMVYFLDFLVRLKNMVRSFTKRGNFVPTIPKFTKTAGSEQQP